MLTLHCTELIQPVLNSVCYYMAKDRKTKIVSTSQCVIMGVFNGQTSWLRSTIARWNSLSNTRQPPEQFFFTVDLINYS